MCIRDSLCSGADVARLLRGRPGAGGHPDRQVAPSSGLCGGPVHDCRTHHLDRHRRGGGRGGLRSGQAHQCDHNDCRSGADVDKLIAHRATGSRGVPVPIPSPEIRRAVAPLLVQPATTAIVTDFDGTADLRGRDGHRDSSRPGRPVCDQLVDVRAAAAVVVVALVGLARSEPTTTTTSAVPIEVMGAAVVYGTTAEAGRWSDLAIWVAACSWPAT